MADDWIKREAESIRRADQERQQREEMRQRHAGVMKVRAPAFFAAAVEETRRAVQSFNSEFRGDANRQLEFSELESGVISVSGLGAVRTATLEDGGVIRVETESGFLETSDQRVMLELSVDDRDQVTCAQGESTGPDAVARALLRPFLAELQGH